MITFIGQKLANTRGRSAWASLCATLLLLITGCGGGSTAGSSPPATEGNVYLGLTDADGDFLTYSVDVLSLKLKKADGAVVETVPVSPRVDFAQLVDLTEFVTAATIPSGDYVEGSIRLDYTNADIQLDVGGTAKAARIVDEAGNAVGVVDLAIRLDNRNHLVIAPGRPRFIELDFDLAASNSVGDLALSPVPVTLRPFVVAAVEPAESKEIRVRGPLVSVDTNAGTYTIDVRPFHHPSARLGRLTVHTSAQTMWEIDGTPYTGAAGLTVLAAEPAGTPTAAFGTLTTANREFTAERVEAGTSVESSQFDALSGNVIARSGNSLTVRGVTLDRRDGSVKFMRGDATLIVGANTKVTKEGGGGLLTPDAISVGQRVRAFGVASTEDTAGKVTLDASDGRVRLKITHVIGIVESANPGNLTIAAKAFDGHRSSVFNFSGTGASPSTDADPAHYEIATGSLDLNLLMPGTPTRVFGFVTPFGSAPPDFTGRTVVDFANVPAILGVGWRPGGTAAPFSSMNASGLVIDAQNPDLGLRHHIVLGFQVIDITTLATPVRLVPAPNTAANRATYAIGKPGQVEIFSDFADFVSALVNELASAKAVGLTASGHFDAGTGDYTTGRVLIMLKPNG
jgi:hypothetical protein